MLNLEYFFVCQSYAADHRTRSVSAFHIANTLIVPVVPSRYSELNGISHWRGDGHRDVELRVISPGGEPVNKFPHTLDGNASVQTMVFPVTNIPINEYGLLTFELWSNDKMLARQAIEIKEAPGNH